jgi:uncharacterized protein YlxW (UPF0749 family)
VPVDLLHQVMTATLDPDYAAVARRRAGSTRVRTNRAWRPAAALAVVLLGMLVSAAALERERTAPQAEQDRAVLIERVTEVRASIARTQAATEELRADMAAIQGAATVQGEREEVLASSLASERVLAGSVPVTGPGLRIVVNDAADPGRRGEGLVTDRDLQVLVNGLWESGAEAIAINGNRLGPLSAIRVAGEAITVNYRSLSAPYTVEAIGDPATLQARFIDTAAGQAWLDLQNNYGLRFDPSEREELTLPATPVQRLSSAKALGGLP